MAEDGEHARSLYPHLLRKLEGPAGLAVLDVGCGTGAVLAQLAERGYQRLAGLDLAPNMIAVARDKLGARADLRVGEADRLPWPAEQFDVVLCGDSFHHYPQPGAALTEMRRVLKPGGRLLLGDLWFPAPVRVVANWLLPLGTSGDVHIYSEKELRALLQAGGFGCLQWELVTQNACLVTAIAA